MTQFENAPYRDPNNNNNLRPEVYQELLAECRRNVVRGTRAIRPYDLKQALTLRKPYFIYEEEMRQLLLDAGWADNMWGKFRVKWREKLQ